MEIDIQSPVRASQVTDTCPIPTETTPLSIDDGAYPDPTGAVPPSAEQISSFLRHARRHATDGATATTASAAAILAVPPSPDVTEGDATAIVHVVNSDTAASPTLKRKRKYSPAHAAQRQRRRDDRRGLDDSDHAPDGGNAQAGGSGGSRV